MKTRRQVLIEAGVPAEELALVSDPDLDRPHTDANAAMALAGAFAWSKSPQGRSYWEHIQDAMMFGETAITQSGHAKLATIACAPAIRAWLCIADDGNVAAAITLDAADVYRRAGRTIVPLYAEQEREEVL